MPRAIVKQPNGMYALWSTIVDDFILMDATLEECVEEEVNDRPNYKGGRDALLRDMCQEVLNLQQTGRAWKWAPTWEEAIHQVRSLHGDEKAEEREKCGKIPHSDILSDFHKWLKSEIEMANALKKDMPVSRSLFTRIDTLNQAMQQFENMTIEHATSRGD